jgi:hypothetical protein
MNIHRDIYNAIFDVEKRNRISVWLLGGIATLFCVTAAIYAYSWGISKQAEYEWTANENARKYANYTYGPERSACLREPIQNQPYCIAQADDKKRDYQRNEDDLIAQKSTAVWTFLMGCAAIVGVALSALGIFLVWTTFRATREGNNIAREIGEAQVRAYLSVASATYQLGKKSISARVSITNVGQSTASSVKISGRLSVYMVGGMAKVPRVLSYVTTETNEIDCQPIVAGRETAEVITFFWPTSFIIESDDAVELRTLTFSEGNEISFDLTISWVDVFRRRHKIPVAFFGSIDAGPNSPKKTRRPRGQLEFRVSEH